MAKIMKARELSWKLFPSLIAVSDNLFACVVEETEKQFGDHIKKITQGMIEKAISTVSGDVIFVPSHKGRTIFLPVTITEIALASHEHNYGIVDVCLLFPIRGESKKVQSVINMILKEVELGTAHYAQNGIELKVLLTDKNLPCQISPNPFLSHNGNGQKAFVIKGEILSGCSIIR